MNSLAISMILMIVVSMFAVQANADDLDIEESHTVCK